MGDLLVLTGYVDFFLIYCVRCVRSLSFDRIGTSNGTRSFGQLDVFSRSKDVKDVVVVHGF